MQVSLTEGLCLRFGAASLFLTIACEPLNIVCGQNLMILALELSDSWSSGGVTCSCKDEGGVTRLHTQCGWVSRSFRHVPWIRERLPI